MGILSFYSKMQENKGAVALEAILSMILMFAILFAMVSGAIIAYNQSQLNTATQLASQGALVVYDREAYRGGLDSARNSDAVFLAGNTAITLFSENTHSLLPDVLGKEATSETISPFNIISCASSFQGPFTANNCLIPTTAPNGHKITRARVRGQINTSYVLLQILSKGVGDNPTERTQAKANSSADTYSLAPGGFE